VTLPADRAAWPDDALDEWGHNDCNPRRNDD